MEKELSTLSQLMFSLIEVWKRSGMTQKDFCTQKEIALPKFQYWVKKYSKRNSGTGEFVAMKVSGSGISSRLVPVELHWPDGRRLVFPGGVEASFLKALLD